MALYKSDYYYYYYYYDPATLFPGNEKNYKKVQKSSWNEPYSTSSFTKQSCSKNALYRWIKTESRWNKKLISLSSPDWSASLRQSLERKTRPDALIGPNDLLLFTLSSIWSRVITKITSITKYYKLQQQSSHEAELHWSVESTRWKRKLPSRVSPETSAIRWPKPLRNETAEHLLLLFLSPPAQSRRQEN